MTPETLKKFIDLNFFGRIRAKPKKIAKPESFAERAALITATCGGIGYLPLVPATWGSAAGIGIYLLAQAAGERLSGSGGSSVLFFASALDSITLILLIVLFLTGIWASSRVIKLTGEKDPSIVVIDEVVGQLVTFLFVPARLGWWTIVLGFLAFRFFDIYKVYPTGEFEKLPSGLGAMADDAMAGVYAAALMSVVCTVYLAV